MESEPCHLGRIKYITKMGFTRLSTAESNQTNKAQSYTRTNIWGPQIFVKCGKYHAHTSTRPSHQVIHTLTKAHIISLVIHYILEDISNKIIVCRFVRENYYLS